MSLQKPRIGRPNVKLFEDLDAIALFDPVRQWLSRNCRKNIPDTLSNIHLSRLALQLLQFQEDYFGSQVPDLAPKLPPHVFYDVQSGGGLCRIFSTAYRFRRDQGWSKFPLSSPPSEALQPRLEEMWSRLYVGLETRGVWARPIVYLSKRIEKSQGEQLSTIVQRFGGRLVNTEEEASHLVYPSSPNSSTTNGETDPDSQEEIRVILRAGKACLLHWRYAAESQQLWTYGVTVNPDTVPVEAPPQPPSGCPWELDARWLLNTQSNREWAPEEDYLVPDQPWTRKMGFPPVQPRAHYTVHELSAPFVPSATTTTISTPKSTTSNSRRKRRRPESPSGSSSSSKPPRSSSSSSKTAKRSLGSSRQSDCGGNEKARSSSKPTKKSKKSSRGPAVPAGPPRDPTLDFPDPDSVSMVTAVDMDEPSVVAMIQFQARSSYARNQYTKGEPKGHHFLQLNSDLDQDSDASDNESTVAVSKTGDTTGAEEDSTKTDDEKSMSNATVADVPPADAPELLDGCSDSNTLLAPPPPRCLLIPARARWFDQTRVHEVERRALPELFPCPEVEADEVREQTQLYKAYRDFILDSYRLNPQVCLSFAYVRRHLSEGSPMILYRIFNQLCHWGLVNTQQLAHAALWPGQQCHQQRGAEGGDPLETAVHHAPLHILTSSLEETGEEDVEEGKETWTLDMQQWGKEGEPPEMGDRHLLCLPDPPDNKINQEFGLHYEEPQCKQAASAQSRGFQSTTSREWSEEETLALLEAVELFGDDWNQVAERVGSRCQDECILRMMRLPIEDPYLDGDASVMTGPLSSKLTPFASSGNPVMTTVAFISHALSPMVASAAAKAAIREYCRILGKQREEEKERMLREASADVKEESNDKKPATASPEMDSVKAKVEMESEETDKKNSPSPNSLIAPSNSNHDTPSVTSQNHTENPILKDETITEETTKQESTEPLEVDNNLLVASEESKSLDVTIPKKSEDISTDVSMAATTEQTMIDLTDDAALSPPVKTSTDNAVNSDDKEKQEALDSGTATTATESAPNHGGSSETASDDKAEEKPPDGNIADAAKSALVVAAALEAARAKASHLAGVEERKLRALMLQMIELQVKRVELKIKIVQEIELARNRELQKVSQQRELILAERKLFHSELLTNLEAREGLIPMDS